jgi:hypothetical protein
MNKGKISFCILIFLCAVIVRSVGVPFFFFSPDELMDLGVSQGASLREVLHRSTVEVHPPLEQLMKRLLLWSTDNVAVIRGVYCCLGLMAVTALSLAAYTVGGLSAGLTCFTIAAFVPAYVSISLLVRGYGLFALAIALALREFFLLGKSPSPYTTGRSWALALWLALACATNFAGFPFACAILLSLASLRATNRSPTRYMFIGTIAAALALEGAVLWWWYFSPETGAAEWRAMSRSPYFEQCAAFQSLSLWVVRLLTLFVPLPVNLIPAELFVTVGAALVVLYVRALARLRNTHRELVVFACIAWGLSTALNFAGFYPLVGPRHSIWLLPGIFIPLSVVWGHFILAHPRVIGLLVVTITAFSLKGWYFNHTNDFPLPTANYQAAKDFIQREVATEDIIITDRFGLLYVLYEHDRLRTFYEPSEPIYSTSFLGHRVLASTPERRWQLTQQDITPLMNELQTKSAQEAKVWLLSLGFKDNVMEQLRRCAEERQIPLRTMDLAGVSIVGGQTRDFTRLFGSSSECFADYRDNLCAKRI